jgi:hypothetical protein
MAFGGLTSLFSFWIDNRLRTRERYLYINEFSGVSHKKRPAPLFYREEAFTWACFISPGDVLPFMNRFPLQKLHLFGQEGVTSPGKMNILGCSHEVVDKWIDIAYSLYEREELLAYSSHLMYVGRKI